MPNPFTRYFLEQYPKKYIKKVRKKAKKLNCKILKKGVYCANERVKIKNLQDIFDLVNMPYMHESSAHELYGGAEEEKRLPKKLIIDPNLKAFLDARLTNVAAAIRNEPPPVKEPKVRPKEEDIPIPPPFAPELSGAPMAPVFGGPMPMQPIQYLQAPAKEHDFLQELKDYKDSIEYVRGICPLLRRDYKKKDQQEIPKNLTKRMQRALKRMEDIDRKLLMRR